MDEKTSEYGWAQWKKEWAPVLTLLFLSAWFFFTFFNRFSGLRSGDGEFGGGIVFLLGRRPYRDYFTAGPPLNQLKGVLELSLFGKALIVSRTMGALERLVIACVLYVWLRKIVTAKAAFLASLVTIIVSAGDRTDPIASYNHDAIFFAMLCGLAASYSLRLGKQNAIGLFAIAAGVSAGLSFLTKQTVGAAAMIGVLVFASVAIARMHGLRKAGLWTTSYVLSFSACLGCMAIYLWHLGVLRACLTMLFVSGPAAKASHSFLFLSREIMIARDNWLWLMLGLIGLSFSSFAILRALVEVPHPKRDDLQVWLRLAAGCAVVIGVAELLALTSLPALDDFGKASVYYSFIGCAIVGVVSFVIALQRDANSSQRSWQIALFAALAWSVAAALSLSWPAFEAMALPGLGLLLALAFDGTRKPGRSFLCLVMAAMVFIQIREKLDTPFSFDHQDEAAVRFASVKSQETALRGMRLPPETVRLIDNTMHAIRERAGTDDTIFTYPEMGIFYALSGHKAPTWTDSHNIDVVQDSFARAEAERLSRSRPAVIIYARPSEANLESDERLWREGRPSGQRSIVSVLDSMVLQYRLAGTYQLTPQDNPIRVYVLPPMQPVDSHIQLQAR